MSALPVCVLSVNDPADKERGDMFAFLAAGGTLRRAGMIENTLIVE